ncbi:MAG TPA: hypothetical protein VKP65_00320 [Rhodothermales bacterium]|nr:hypothetical protein [Rhodothermales bacterium]
MKRSIRRKLAREKQKIKARLEPFIGGTEPREEGQPELSGPRPTYEFAERTAYRCHVGNRGCLGRRSWGTGVAAREAAWGTAAG